MITILTVLSALLLLCIPAAYYYGRKSAAEDRQWARATRLPRLNAQPSSDAAEEGRDGTLAAQEADPDVRGAAALGAAAYALLPFEEGRTDG